MKITKNSDKLKIEGHRGTWYVLDETLFDKHSVFLLEHEEFGEEAPSLIVDENGKILLEEVWDGFQELECFSSWGELLNTRDED